MNISFCRQSGKWTGERLGLGRPVRGYLKVIINYNRGLARVSCWWEREKDMNVRNSGTGIDMDIRVMGSIGKGRTQMSHGLG